jgi:hypothetical protein
MDDWAKMDDKMKQVKEQIAQLKKGQEERGMCAFLGFGTLMVRRGYVLPDHVGTFDAMRWLPRGSV